MKIPFVKVNNQKEFDRVAEKMKIETGLKLWEGSEFYGEWDVLSESNGKLLLYKSRGYILEGEKIISADEYLNRRIENFTLLDLEDGMVVELRNKDLFMYINKNIIGLDSWMPIGNCNEDYENTRGYKTLDIVKVYQPKSYGCSFKFLLEYDNLTLIFDAEAHRNKLTIEAKKTEIRAQIDKLKQQLEELNG